MHNAAEIVEWFDFSTSTVYIRLSAVSCGEKEESVLWKCDTAVRFSHLAKYPLKDTPLNATITPKFRGEYISPSTRKSLVDYVITAPLLFEQYDHSLPTLITRFPIRPTPDLFEGLRPPKSIEN